MAASRLSTGPCLIQKGLLLQTMLLQIEKKKDRLFVRRWIIELGLNAGWLRWRITCGLCLVWWGGVVSRWTVIQCSPVFSGNFTPSGHTVKVTSGQKVATAEGFTFVVRTRVQREKMSRVCIAPVSVCWSGSLTLSLRPGPRDSRNLPDIRAEVGGHHADHQGGLPGHGEQAGGDDRERGL